MRTTATWLSMWVVLAAPALAATPKPKAPPAQTAEPVDEARRWRVGPEHVDLGHDIGFELPEGHAFLAKEGAAKLLEKNGSFHNENLLGLITSAHQEGTPWFVVIRYDEEGFIKDDEKLDAADILKAIREGQEEANKERVERGFRALRIGEWREPPQYEPGPHHLVWALDAIADADTSVNYSTRVLGRKGYVSLNLVTDPTGFAENRSQVSLDLAGVKFAKGSRYEDFDKGKDKVAEYGLAGLVLGGAGLAAAKLVKVGLIAKFGKVILAALIAGKKLVVVGLAAAVAFLKRLFGGKKKADPVAPPEA